MNFCLRLKLELFLSVMQEVMTQAFVLLLNVDGFSSSVFQLMIRVRFGPKHNINFKRGENKTWVLWFGGISPVCTVCSDKQYLPQFKIESWLGCM